MKAPSVLTTPSVPLVLGCRRGADLWYFDRYAQVGPPEIYPELTRFATASVDIWDPYFTADDHILLAGVAPGITVRHLFQGATYPAKCAVYRAQIDATSKRYPQLAFSARYCCSNEGPGFHDRFLIVDHARLFAVGASLRSHYRDDRSTGVVELRHLARSANAR